MRTPMPEPMTKIQQLTTKVAAAQGKMLREKDAEKQEGTPEGIHRGPARGDREASALYREVVEKYADSPAALDAAVTCLLRGAARDKLTPDDAAKFVKVVQKKGSPYGPLFVGVSLAPVAETLAGQKGLEAVAVAAIEPAAKAMTDEHPARSRSHVLSAYQTALAKAGKSERGQGDRDAPRQAGNGNSTPST